MTQTAPLPLEDQDRFAAMREAMVSNQLRTVAVNDPRVVDAMRRVPRERFVPEGRRSLAYVDTLLPLGARRWLNPPMVTGRLLTACETRAADRALVVGAASGYGAAVLARLVASVVALEEDEVLAASMPVDIGVTPARGPLAEGWAAGAPYDVILIDGVVERLPDALVGQLAPGGRLAAGLLTNGVTRLVIGRRSGGFGAGAGFGTIAFADAEAAPLPGFAPPPRFTF